MHMCIGSIKYSCWFLITDVKIVWCRWKKASAIAEGDDTGSQSVPRELPFAKLWSGDCYVWACNVDDTYD